MILKDVYGMIDGVINDGKRCEKVEKAKEVAEMSDSEKKLLRKQMEDARRERSERKPPEKGRPNREAPEHGVL